MDKKDNFAQKGSTWFLRATVLALGIVILALCAIVLPAVHNEWPSEYPEMAYLRYPVLLALTVTAILFFIASYHTLKLLNLIDKNKAFSELSIDALKIIKFCAIGIGTVYAAAMPLIYYTAEHDDAPGLIVIGMVFVCAPLVIAVFAAVLQRLLQSAITIKTENDLTV